LNGQYVFLVQLGGGFVRGRVPIESHFLWYSPLLDRLPKEALRGSTIAVSAQEEVDGLSCSVNSAIQRDPFPLHC